MTDNLRHLLSAMIFLLLVVAGIFTWDAYQTHVFCTEQANQNWNETGGNGPGPKPAPICLPYIEEKTEVAKENHLNDPLINEPPVNGLPVVFPSIAESRYAALNTRNGDSNLDPRPATGGWGFPPAPPVPTDEGELATAENDGNKIKE